MAKIEDPPLPENFAGRVRLFPLPNLVLFPRVLQPLHVFEPRYKALLEEALAGDVLIAMALLAPGWQQDYEGRPPLYPMCCIAGITTHQKLDNGRYNILLTGLRRARIERELPPDRPFREALVSLPADRENASSAAERPALRAKMCELVQRLLRRLPQAKEQFEQMLGASVPLGVLTDILAYTLQIDCAVKQQLLEELDVDRRATLLLDHLNASDHELSPARRRMMKYPPDFSAN